ncbi:MAG: enoyl-CoA hydratase/isomerase family protein [Allosphingosinicella sp.]
MLRLDLEDSIARLTLDRPKARNAIPASGWSLLEGRLSEVERSAAHLLVIQSEGDAFCAGADLGDFDAMRGDAPACIAFRASMRAALDRLRNLRIPTLAVIEGACYGAGVALAMACDLRLAGRNARFAITPAKIGISYPQEDVHRLVELVGPGQAARLLFTAAPIDGDEALAMGLVEWFDPEGGAGPLIEAICANAGASLAHLKRGIRLAAGGLRCDPGQDEGFDLLVGGDELARRLEALRRK